MLSTFDVSNFHQVCLLDKLEAMAEYISNQCPGGIAMTVDIEV